MITQLVNNIITQCLVGWCWDIQTIQHRKTKNYSRMLTRATGTVLYTVVRYALGRDPTSSTGYESIAAAPCPPPIHLPMSQESTCIRPIPYGSKCYSLCSSRKRQRSEPLVQTGTSQLYVQRSTTAPYSWHYTRKASSPRLTLPSPALP
jgi:hypothetical protein